MDDESKFEDRYGELQSQYLGRVRRRLETIEQLVSSLRDEFDREEFDELYQLVHRLSGSGETMGFPEVSRLSIELEERLDGAGAGNREEWLPAVESYCRDLRTVASDD